MKTFEIKIPHYGIWDTRCDCFVNFMDNSLFWTTSFDVAREQLKRFQLSGSEGYLAIKEIGKPVTIKCNESE